jgi:predicted HicB family RNase H-like nuclease
MKQHANTGNQHAKKYSANERNAKLHIGCAQADKNAWVKAAQAEDKKLGVWVIEQLNNSVKN